MQGVTASDILTAFICSSLFWVTVAGVAVRGLKVDFERLESYLASLFGCIDRMRIEPLDAAGRATQAILHSVYVKSRYGPMLVAGVVACVLNLYLLSLLYDDWKRREVEIGRLEQVAISRVSKKYFALISSEDGRHGLTRAFESSVSPEFGRIFHNNSGEDVAIRGIYDDYSLRMRQYITDNDMYYDMQLALFFGDGYQNIYWQSSRIGQLAALLMLVIAVCSVVDAVAASMSVRLAEHLFAGRVVSALGSLVGIVLCFTASLVNYKLFFAGWPLALTISVTMAFGAGMLVLMAVAGLAKLSESDFRAPWICAIVTALAFVVVVLVVSTPRGYGQLAVSQAHAVSRVLAGRFDPKVTLMSMATLFPLVMSIALSFLVYVLTAVLNAFRVLFLGQVYGASVLSGGTYFLGFLTAIVSCTTAAVALMKWLQQ